MVITAIFAAKTRSYSALAVSTAFGFSFFSAGLTPSLPAGKVLTFESTGGTGLATLRVPSLPCLIVSFLVLRRGPDHGDS